MQKREYRKIVTNFTLKIIMKIFLFIIGLVGLLIAGITIACTSSDELKESKISPELRIKIEQVGILHNQGLDSILMDLLKEKKQIVEDFVNQSLSQNNSPVGFPADYDFRALVYNTTKRVVKNWHPTMSNEYFEAVMFNQHVQKYFRAKTRTSFDDNELDLEDLLTPFQWDYYNMLLAIFENGNITLEQLLAEILDLETQIEMAAPTIDEAVLLLYAASVARYSAEYWYENIENWLISLIPIILPINPSLPSIIGGDEGPLSLMWSWKNFGKADLSGAIGGAIGGGMAGAGPGALGGGIGNSAIYAFERLWDWLF